MPSHADLALKTFDSSTSGEILDDAIIPLWESIYAETAAADPFFSTERFIQRFHGYTAAPGFSLCIASDPAGNAVGMAFGYPLQPGSRWWNGLQTSVPSEFTQEDGKRTFAINEIMVIESLRRQGIATVLHRHLLAGRPESRATLLVEPENVPARNAYLHWGWAPMGMLKPFSDSPLYESMILSLPLADQP
jgi:ribosomal protein S18 acetylase RimI-like enzyme